jgi:hypothetical protein
MGIHIIPWVQGKIIPADAIPQDDQDLLEFLETLRGLISVIKKKVDYLSGIHTQAWRFP